MAAAAAAGRGPEPNPPARREGGAGSTPVRHELVARLLGLLGLLAVAVGGARWLGASLGGALGPAGVPAQSPYMHP